MYDIFFVLKSNTSGFQKLKSRYPRAKIVSDVQSFEDLKNKSFTKMFWTVWDDVILSETFDLDSYRATKWDDMYVHVFKNDNHYDGICLFSKQNEISDREWINRYFINKKEVDIAASRPQRFEKHILTTYEDYQNILESSTDMFWGQWADTEILDESIFDLYFQHHNFYDRNENHVFKNLCNGEATHKQGLILFSKNKPISRREFDQRYLVDKKEYDRIVTKSCYPRLIFESYEEYQKSLQSANEMFWCVWSNVSIIDNSVFDCYFDPYNGVYDYDRSVNHVFKNLCNDQSSYLNGIVLFSKNSPISKKEFERKYLIDKKEHDIVASRFRYPTAILDNYQSYLDQLTDMRSDLFWGIWPNVDIIDESIFDFYYDPNDGKYDHDRKTNHVFKNLCNDQSSYLNGIVLFSKNSPISKKEFERKYLIDKKEHDRPVSRFRYLKMHLNNYNDYLTFLENTESDLFWGIWPNVDIIDESIFDFYYDPNDGKYDHDRKTNHVFLNGCDQTSSYLNGVVLFSKNSPISKKEFERKYLIDKKEHNRLVSRFRYPRYQADTYDDYKNIQNQVTSDMFWIIWPEINVNDESVFDLYFDPNNGKYDFDRNINHVFKHNLRKNEQTYNGLVLFSKNAPVSKKEIEYRYIINKKEYDKTVSNHKLYDIVFVSYNEPNADKNWELLKNRFPNAKRVHGVKGIHQAHIAAANLAETDMFYVVDGDAILKDDFNFDYTCSGYERKTVHVWRSQNPINDLEYGYGGIKLLPRKLTIVMDITSADMTTSISDQFKIMTEVSNITEFNTDAFSTWRSAFRECVKLSSRSITRQNDKETTERLEIWSTVGQDRPYGKDAIRGAKAGIAFGTKHKGDQSMLSKINDFEWLKEQYGI
jgi:hypothetical protein